MTDSQPPTSNPQPPAKREPAGPGLMIVFGLGLLVLGAWCGWDSFFPREEWIKEQATWKVWMNGVGMAAAVIAAIYCFVQAAKRSKKPQG